MSSMSIDECIARIEKYPSRIAPEARATLQAHAPHGRTGGLVNSIVYYISANSVEAVANAYYAYWVDRGRDPVKPVEKKALSNNIDFGPVAHAKKSRAKHFEKKAAKELKGKLKSLF